MTWARGLVLLMSVECVGASFAYFYNHNWKLGFYWALAAGINAIVSTF